jgi:hypothetical protein
MSQLAISSYSIKPLNPRPGSSVDLTCDVIPVAGAVLPIAAFALCWYGTMQQPTVAYIELNPAVSSVGWTYWYQPGEKKTFSGKVPIPSEITAEDPALLDIAVYIWTGGTTYALDVQKDFYVYPGNEVGANWQWAALALGGVGVVLAVASKKS